MEQNQEIIDVFLGEAGEIIEKLGADLAALNEDSGNLELWSNVFRYVHTLKGNAALLGFDDVAKVAGPTESVLDRVKSGDLPVEGEVKDTLSRAFETLKTLIGNIREGRTSEVNLDDLVARLDGMN